MRLPVDKTGARQGLGGDLFVLPSIRHLFPYLRAARKGGALCAPVTNNGRALQNIF